MTGHRQSRVLKRLFRRHFHHGSPSAGGWDLFCEILEICGSTERVGDRIQRQMDLRGLLHLRDAAEILLTLQMAPHEALIKQRLIRQLFTYLRRINRLHPEWGLADLPQLTRNRMAYFLWQASLGQPLAAWALLAPCTQALRRAEREWPVRPEVERGALDRLPFELAQFIRAFPPNRLTGRRLIGPLLKGDIRAAFASRRASPRGFQSANTETEYVNTVSRALGLDNARLPSAITVSSSGWPALRSLSDNLGEDVRVELLSEADGVLRGLLACPETIPSDDAHPFEDAILIRPDGPWRAWTQIIPRADQHPTTWDATGLTPNEFTRFMLQLVRTDLTTAEARFRFLLGEIVFTGLLPKRVLGAHLWTGEAAALEAWLADKEAAIAANDADLVIVGPRARTLWVKAYSELSSGDRQGDVQLLRVMRLPLPEAVWRLSEIAWPTMMSSDPPGRLAFPASSGRPLDITVVRDPLRAIGQQIAPLDPDLRLPRLRRTLSRYAAAAGVSSFVVALASGSFSLQARVLNHYISYPTATFWRRCTHLQAALLNIARTVAPGARPAWDDEEAPPPAWLPSGRYGSGVSVDSEAIRHAWHVTRAAFKAARRFNRRLNLATLLTATQLVAGAGVRQLELSAIRRDQVDLEAGLLRIHGKTNKYFTESREIPLNRLLVSVLARYLDLLDRSGVAGSTNALFWIDFDGLAPLKSGDLDRIIGREGLDWAWPFRPAWLRHWLRTGLELAGADEAAVNEAFGHATSVMTALHPLSSADLPRLQDTFRAATTTILDGIIEEGW